MLPFSEDRTSVKQEAGVAAIDPERSLGHPFAADAEDRCTGPGKGTTHIQKSGDLLKGHYGRRNTRAFGSGIAGFGD